ncbi:hypothetical protein BH11MYX3_BH11MYX3_14570 [soil metagenome]
MFGPHDGRRVSVPPYRRMMAFLMRGRNESAVYFEQQLDLSRTLPWLGEWNAAHPGKRATVFHLVLHSLATVLHERERLNRFTVGRKTYQRTGVFLSFAAKQQKSDDHPLRTIKRGFAAGESFAAVVDATSGEVTDVRKPDPTPMDKELGILLKLPGFLLAFLLAMMKRLYAWGIAPRSLVDTDPLYTSAFLANLGSIGLDAAYHHLYEHGNCPLFVVLGRIDNGTLTIKYSYDERVEDGLYCAKALQLLKARIEDP